MFPQQTNPPQITHYLSVSMIASWGEVTRQSDGRGGTRLDYIVNRGLRACAITLIILLLFLHSTLNVLLRRNNSLFLGQWISLSPTLNNNKFLLHRINIHLITFFFLRRRILHFNFLFLRFRDLVHGFGSLFDFFHWFRYIFSGGDSLLVICSTALFKVLFFLGQFIHLFELCGP